MIVRESGNYFVLIDQTDHAELSGKLAEGWKKEEFPGSAFRQSVEYASAHHDDGWGPFDKAPFLNDQTQMPYSFNDFPEIPKTVLYKQGVDQVEEQDVYAAFLCSVHYVNFYKNPDQKELQAFIENEKKRQSRLRERIGEYSEEDFDAHYDVLQFVDALSLFVCLNEPGTSAQEGHPFFQNGIPVPSFLKTERAAVFPEWLDNDTLGLDIFPFERPVEGTLRLKKVPKAAITEKGLLKAYEGAFEEDLTIRFISF